MPLPLLAAPLASAYKRLLPGCGLSLCSLQDAGLSLQPGGPEVRVGACVIYAKNSGSRFFNLHFWRSLCPLRSPWWPVQSLLLTGHARDLSEYKEEVQRRSWPSSTQRPRTPVRKVPSTRDTCDKYT